MSLSWNPVVIIDISGSVLMLLISSLCAVYSWQLTKKKPKDVFTNYIFLFTLAILFFSVSRSVGHLFKQVLLLNDMAHVWKHLSPFSGAINSTAFVVIFAFGISFRRFQKVSDEIEYYKENLEDLVEVRTEELEEAKNKLEYILNNSNPINITGLNFDLLQANEAYYEIWPNRASNSGTLKCYESRPGDHCHTDHCPLQLIMNGEDLVSQEVSKEINGDQRDFIITARPFCDLNGRLIGMVESFHEITLRKRAERALLKMDKMKSEFISTAAHELNTPLSTIMGYTEFLRTPQEFGDFTDEQKRQFVNEIHDHGEVLSRLVDDLLDITRIESGRPIPMVMAEASIPDLLSRKVKSYIAPHPDHTFKMNLPADALRPLMNVDSHRINQALENLLSNAVKFSPGGSDIIVSAIESPEGWEVTVADQGVGMNSEQLEKVFEKFYRADASNTATKGLGLGMSIVKQVIESHGGWINVESTEGEGTRATFFIPFSSSGDEKPVTAAD